MSKIDYTSIFGKPAEEIGSIIKDLQMFFDKDIIGTNPTPPVPPVPPTPSKPANNEIWYTGEYYDMQAAIDFISDNWSEPYKGPAILSNELVGDHYVITFDSDITAIGSKEDIHGSGDWYLYPMFVTDDYNDVPIITCNVTSVVLPDTVTYMEYGFYECDELEVVTLPENLNYLDYSSFYDCDLLEDLIYQGTKEQWGKIEKRDWYDNTPITTIHCTDGNIILGNPVNVIIDDEYYELYDSMTYAEQGYTNLYTQNYYLPGESPDDYSYDTSTNYPQEKDILYTYCNEENISAVLTLKDGSTVNLTDKTYISESDIDPYRYTIVSADIRDCVTDIGSAAFANSTLTSVTIPSSVVNISASAFLHCNVDSINIPDSVTYIGSYAFSDIPNVIYNGSATGAPWEAKCVNGYVENSLVYSDSTKTILKACYHSNPSYLQVNVPDSVTEISDNAFSYCDNVYGINLGTNILTIGKNAFGSTNIESINIPYSVTSIGQDAFYGNSRLKTVIIGDQENGSNLTSMDKWIFRDCSVIESVICYATTPPSTGVNIFDDVPSNYKIYVPNDSVNSYKNTNYWNTYSSRIVSVSDVTVLYLNDNSKIYLTGDSLSLDVNSVSNKYSNRLIGADLGNNVVSVGWATFRGCNGLTSINIPSSVTSVSGDAFQRCSNLTSMTVDPNNTLYDSRDNCNAIIETSTNTLISGCKNSTIPNTVTTIGEDSFNQCEGLTSVTIPSSVTTIGDAAFIYCSGLTSLSIPSSVTTIGRYAFNNCSGLTSVTIPNNVFKLGDDSFGNCNSLTTATVSCSAISTEQNYKGSNLFAGCSNLTTVVLETETTIVPYGLCQGCSKLTSVTIPGTITRIPSNPFWDCTILSAITFNGTMEQWSHVSVDSEWKYGTRISVVHCTDGDVNV